MVKLKAPAKRDRFVQLFSLKKEPTRYNLEEVPSLKSSAHVLNFMRPVFGDTIGVYESFYLILLNQGLKPIGIAPISSGGIANVLVDLRIVGKYAVSSLATSVILVHNHPSGSTTPSPEDRTLTERIKKGLALLEVRVLDHLILTEDSFYSFADNGEI